MLADLSRVMLADLLRVVLADLSRIMLADLSRIMVTTNTGISVYSTTYLLLLYLRAPSLPEMRTCSSIMYFLPDMLSKLIYVNRFR